jgi:hypothetical protein
MDSDGSGTSHSAKDRKWRWSIYWFNGEARSTRANRPLILHHRAARALLPGPQAQIFANEG